MQKILNVVSQIVFRYPRQWEKVPIHEAHRVLYRNPTRSSNADP
jgi:hypothetical protein